LIKSAVNLLEYVTLPDDVINEIVESTFQNLNKNLNKEDYTTIDFNQYREMVRDNPNILKWLYVDLEKMKISAQIILKNPKSYTYAKKCSE